MTVGYYTDNSVSQAFMRALSAGGTQVSHIKDFYIDVFDPVFYGILRGTGRAMLQCQSHRNDFYYADNGYFAAIYMNERKHKDMSGKFRIVKNDMIEPIKIEPTKTAIGKMRIMLMPPSPYTAFMYDTLPEEWLHEWATKIIEAGHEYYVRDKEDQRPFDKAVADFDAVFAFNSMAVVKAIELGKAVYTTHGIIRNSLMLDMCAPYFDIEAIAKFYENKQFTLEQIKDLGVKCLT